MASDRIDKFSEDAATGKGLSKECDRLAAWLQKHQSEIVPAAQQAKLMQLLDLHTKSGKEQYPDSLGNLVSTLLALPEGKLISAKSKQRCLRLLESLAPSSSKPPSPSGGQQRLSKYTVLDCDVSAGEVTVCEEGNEDVVLEHVRCPPDLLSSLLPAFEQGDVSVVCTLTTAGGGALEVASVALVA